MQLVLHIVTELPVDPLDRRSNSRRADHQLLRDFTVGNALAEQRRDLSFAG
jgi:hypothetical protein